jgi:hypothetical protein
MVRLLPIVSRRSKSVTRLLIICQRWKFLRMETTLNTYSGRAATKLTSAAEEVAEKLNTLSFRGALRAEESLFSSV